MTKQIEDVSLVAYEIYPQSDMSLFPAPVSRQWMDQTYKRFAYRCLPLTMANQAGWMITCPVGFSARWNSGPLPDDTQVTFDNDETDERVASLFGHGTVTFNIPYLFRTPEGMNLWVKGLSNWPKDGVQALEGLVETDWTSASFTMNWKLTRPDNTMRFERGEPICMILSYPRGLLENCVPTCVPISENPELQQSYLRWSAERDAFQKHVAGGDRDAIEARAGKKTTSTDTIQVASRLMHTRHDCRSKCLNVTAKQSRGRFGNPTGPLLPQ